MWTLGKKKKRCKSFFKSREVEIGTYLTLVSNNLLNRLLVARAQVPDEQVVIITN